MKRSIQRTRRFFAGCGRRGGRVRARRLSSVERSTIASRAAQARWGKVPPISSGMPSIRLENPRYDDPAYLEELLSEGSLNDWRGLYSRVADRPFGPASEALENVLSSTEIYGVTPLWKGLLRGVQGGGR